MKVIKFFKFLNYTKMDKIYPEQKHICMGQKLACLVGVHSQIDVSLEKCLKFVLFNCCSYNQNTPCFKLNLMSPGLIQQHEPCVYQSRNITIYWKLQQCVFVKEKIIMMVKMEIKTF